MKIKVFCLLGLFISFMLQAQEPVLLVEARQLERRFKTMEAIKKYETFLVTEPNNIAVLLRLTTLYCMEGDLNANERKSYFTFADQFSLRALGIDSNSADAHLSRAMAMGALILDAPVKEKPAMTFQIRQRIDKALSIDSFNAKAIYTLGKWHDEVSSLNPAARAALKIMNKGFPSASAAEAIELYEKARKLDPGMLPNNYALAIAYKKSGRTDLAIEVLNAQLKLPLKTSEDQAIKLKSKQLLESLK